MVSFWRRAELFQPAGQRFLVQLSSNTLGAISRRPSIAISALVFDLAGVLLDFGGVESVARLSGGRVGEEEFHRFWLHSPCADLFYRGRCSPQQFAAGAVREFDLSVEPEAFLAEFRAWLRGPYLGAFELVQKLRVRTTVSCLSNTNELDVARFRGELKLPARFDECFFSNETGLRKPDPECYYHVLERLGVNAGDVACFDDNAACVEGARRVGMQAYQCAGVEPLRGELVNLGFPEAARGSDGA